MDSVWNGTHSLTFLEKPSAALGEYGVPLWLLEQRSHVYILELIEIVLAG